MNKKWNTKPASNVASKPKRPVAPPVYKPQQEEKVAQPKTIAAPPKAGVADHNVRPPAAPPVYRPQPLPKVLQRKASAALKPNKPKTPAESLGQIGLNAHSRRVAVVQLAEKPITPSKKEAFLASIQSDTVTITQPQMLAAIDELVRTGRPAQIGNTQYSFAGLVSPTGGSLSLTSAAAEKAVGSVKFKISNGSIDIDEINTTTIYTGQQVFNLLFTAIGAYGNQHGATTITSTNITNSPLWHKLVKEKQFNKVATLLSTNVTVTLPRTIKDNTK